MKDLAIITAPLFRFFLQALYIISGFGIKIKMLFTSLDQSIMERTVPSVLRTTKAGIKTFGTVFHHTNLLAGE